VRWAVILAGGSGTRFWPLSTPRQPKQVLPLAGPRSPAEEAVARLAGLVPAERILLVTGAALAAPLRRQLALPEANVLVEPGPRSTGPALLWASLEALRRDPEATVLSLHADWHVPDPGAFREAAALALATAEAAPVLVTVGVRPTRAETGYGYVVPGEPLGPGGSRRSARSRTRPAPRRSSPAAPSGTRACSRGARERSSPRFGSTRPRWPPPCPPWRRGRSTGSSRR
jgi:mannose-1-phosphate guanylyltransferase